MKTKIIFLLGEAGSGKDTVGNEFVKKGYTRVSFADAMKQEYADKIGIDVQELHVQGPKKEFHRPGLIEFAEAARAIDSLIWLKKGFEPFQDSNKKFKEDLKLVVTDFRRDSEVDWYYEMLQSGEVDLKLFQIAREDVGDKDVLTHYTIGKVKGINKVNLGFIDAVIFLQPAGNKLTPSEYKVLLETAKDKTEKLIFLFDL